MPPMNHRRHPEVWVSGYQQLLIQGPLGPQWKHSLQAQSHGRLYCRLRMNAFFISIILVEPLLFNMDRKRFIFFTAFLLFNFMTNLGIENCPINYAAAVTKIVIITVTTFFRWVSEHFSVILTDIVMV